MVKNKILFILLISSLIFINPNKGKVILYNEEKGFGFIYDNKTKDHLFVYHEGLIDEISKGDSVSYQIRNTRQGHEAYEVRQLKKIKK